MAAKGDRPEGYGLIVTTGAEERVVAHAVFELERPDRAEVAFAVADEMQGRGLATVLIAHLAQVASARGVRDLHRDRPAREPAHDQRLPRVGLPGRTCAPRRTGSSSSSRPSWGRTRGASSRIATGSRRSRRSSGCCKPRSVAVIGASRRPDSFGGAAFRHALDNGFRGELYPVNPNADFIGSRRASAVGQGHARAGRPRDRRRAGRGGARRWRASAPRRAWPRWWSSPRGSPRRARRARRGWRSCSRPAGRPGCGSSARTRMGVVNTDPAVSLTGTFGRADVPAGTVGFVSQSGAFGAAAIDGMSRRGIGLSAFVSLGDKADLSSNDVLQYWEQDPATQVVALYLESFGNPRKFGRVARRVARAKPVLAVKAGRTSAGARAASLAHRRADRGLRQHRRRAVRQRGRDPLRRPRRPARRRRRAGRAADPARRRRRDRLQRPRPGRRLRGRVRRRRASASRRCRAETQDALRAVLPPESIVAGPVQLVAAETPAGFRARGRAGRRRPRGRRRDRDLRRAHRDRRRRGRRRARRRRAGPARRGHAAADRLHDPGPAPGGPPRGAPPRATPRAAPLPRAVRAAVARAAPVPPRGRAASRAASRSPHVPARRRRAARALGRAAAYGRFRARAAGRAARGSTTSTATPRPRCSPARSPAAAGGCGRTRSRRCSTRTGSRWSSSGGSGRSRRRRRRRRSSAGRSR